MMKKDLLLCLLPQSVLTGFLLLMQQFSVAQDLHFSQYNQAPSLINPALTGAMYALRASVIYKDQWKGVSVPYKTFGASFEMKFKSGSGNNFNPNNSNVFKKSLNRLAGGLSFYSDKAGDGNMGSSQVNFSLASFVPIGKISFISVGMQASVVQRTIDFSKLIFPYQLSNGIYDPSSYNGENPAKQSFTFPDVAAGINWSYGYNGKGTAQKSKFKSNVGVAMYHINQPKQNFLSSSVKTLAPRYVLNGDFLISFDNNIALAPSYLIQLQGPLQEIMAGMMLKYYFQEGSKYTGIVKRSAFGFGMAFRNKDAFILSALIEKGQYAMGFSYDVTTSRLASVSSGRGGPEIFLRFVAPNPFLYQAGAKSRYNL